MLDVCEIGVTDVCVSLFLSEFFCFKQHYMEFKEDAERKIRGLEENLASQLNQVLCNKKKKKKSGYSQYDSPELDHKHDSCCQMFRLLEVVPKKSYCLELSDVVSTSLSWW